MSTERTANPDAAYPKDLERHFTLPDGRTVFVRPIRPEDESLYGSFLAAVTPEDLRLRFFAQVKDLDHALAARLTHIDYRRAMAFVALDEATDELLGVVRLHADGALGESARSGEYAVLVRSDLKAHGLGWKLMELIIAYARAKGFRAIHGLVLRDNRAMLKMCGELGFEITGDPNEPDLCDVTIRL